MSITHEEPTQNGYQWKSPFPSERVDYHLKAFGHLPEMECGADMTKCDMTGEVAPAEFQPSNTAGHGHFSDSLPVKKKTVKSLPPKRSRRSEILKRRKKQRKARKASR